MSAKISSAETLPQLLDLLRAESDSFSPRDTSHALHQLARLYRLCFRRLQAPQLASAEAREAARAELVSPSLELIGALVRRQSGGMDAWGVSLAVWSFGLLDLADDALLAALCRRGAAVMREFNPIDCASALVGWARLRARTREQREFVDLLLARTLDSLGSSAADWRPQELANAAWALSRIGAAGTQRRALLETLTGVVMWRLDDFNMQELSTLVYAFAKMQHRVPPLLSRVASKAAHHLDLLQPQDASMLLWGFAKLAFKPKPALLDRLPVAMADRLQEFKPQEVCNLLYGYGVLRHQHPLLMDTAARACAPRLADFSTQDLVLTIWAFGAVRYCPRDPSLLYQACGALMQRRRGLLPMQIAVAMKGFAKAGFQPPPAFMAEAGAAALERLSAFKPVEMCHLLWAYARMGYRDVQLVEAVVARFVALLRAPAPPPPKIAVDTVVWAAQRVGYWPQALVDVAEMRGVYVKAAYPAARQAAAGGGGCEAGGIVSSNSSSGSGGGGGGDKELVSEALAGDGHVLPEAGPNGMHHQAAGVALAGAQPQHQQQEAGLRAEQQRQHLQGQEQKRWQRRPLPTPLSLHQWHQQLQVAQHQDRQHAHQRGQLFAGAGGGTQQQQRDPHGLGRQQPQQQHEQQQELQQDEEQQQQQEEEQQQQQEQQEQQEQQWHHQDMDLWQPSRKVARLLQSADFGDDTPPPEPREPFAAPLVNGRRMQ